jgi:flagellar hook-basal body complex protein FliE
MSKELAENQTQWDLHENKDAVVPLEFTEEVNPEIFGLEVVKAKEMTIGLSVTIAERDVLIESYKDVIQLEITTETLPVFKELRLKIRDNRTKGIQKWKEREKAFYLAGGNFIQAIYNKETEINESMESKLMDAEKFFENKQKEVERLLNESRLEKLCLYVEDTT